jgi:hypothetical protein
VLLLRHRLGSRRKRSGFGLDQRRLDLRRFRDGYECDGLEFGWRRIGDRRMKVDRLGNRLDSLGNRRGFRLGRRQLRRGRHFLHGLDGDGLGRRGLRDRRMNVDRVGNRLCCLGNGSGLRLGRRRLRQGWSFLDRFDSDGLWRPRLNRSELGRRRGKLDRLGNRLRCLGDGSGFRLSRRRLRQGRSFLDGFDSDGLWRPRLNQRLGCRRVKLDRLGNRLGGFRNGCGFGLRRWLGRRTWRRKRLGNRDVKLDQRGLGLDWAL